jgi:glycosyltransferase involved in cell wall biosynthesis
VAPEQSRRKVRGVRGPRPCLVGPYPPPVHGMAAVTKGIWQALEVAACPSIVINTAGLVLNRGWLWRLTRAPRVAAAACQLAWYVLTGQADTLYLAVAGGLGKIYDLVFLVVARLGIGRIILHHHSFAYLEQPNTLAKCLVNVAGSRAVHLVLCEEHGRRLQSAYSKTRSVLVLQNAAFVESFTSLEVKERLCCIGFLGNISYEKGIIEFLTVAEKLAIQHPDIVALVAGPFQDKRVELDVRTRMSALSTVRYLGPTYGEQKAAFFRAVDVLLFPTRYVNEAAPLTIYEALSSGVPVIARDRGCIPQMLTRGANLVIPQEHDFVEEALQYIRYLHSTPLALQTSSRDAKSSFASMAAIADGQLKAVLQLLTRRVDGVSSSDALQLPTK